MPRLTVESLEPRLLLNSDIGLSPAADNVVKWTFGDTQNNLYVLDSYSPQSANLGSAGTLDPTLNLVIGTRYSVTVASFPHHPLEILAGGSTPFDDVVLLAQVNNSDEPHNQTAKWESDPGVDWVNDPATKTCAFTLTPALAAAMFDPALGLAPAYRCGNPYHRGFQRGSFILSSGIPAPKGAPHDDFGASFADAAPIALSGSGSGSVSGAIEANGGVDLFQFVAPSTGLLSATQAAPPGSALYSVLLVYDDSQQLINVGAGGETGAAQLQIPVVAGNTYYLQASGYQESTGPYHLTLAVQPQTTAALGVQPIALDDLGSASLTDTVPVPGGRNDYEFTATTSGQMTITQSALPGSLLDPLLLVDNSSGMLVAADSEGAGSQISRVQFTVVTGQSYSIQAGGLGLSLGSYTLAISTQDSGDSLDEAVPITLSAQGTASQSGQIAIAGEGDYFQVVAPSTGFMTIEEDAAPGSATQVAPSVYNGSGTPLSAVTTTSLAGGTSIRARFPVSEGHVYDLRAAAQGSATGLYTLYLAASKAPDRVSAPVSIALSPQGSATLSGSLGLPGDAVMYMFTAPVSGLMAISQDAAGGTALDSVLSVYDASKTLVASDDDGGGGRNSLVKIAVTAGQTYYVRSSGFGASTGQFTLTLATDNFGHDFASASPITLDSLGSGRVLGSIGSSGSIDVFQVVAAQNQDVAIRLSPDTGSTFDGVIRVYDAQHNFIVASADSGEAHNSVVPLSMVAGQTYYVEVAGFESSIGAYSLLVGDGMGDNFAHAIAITVDSSGLGSQTGWIDRAGDVNTFRFVAPASGVLTVVQVSAPEANFVGSLAAFDAAGTLIASQQDLPVAANCLCQDLAGIGCSCISVPPTLGDTDELSSELAGVRIPVVAGQIYFLKVGNVGTSTGQYVLDLGLNDPNSDSANAVPQDLTFDPTTNVASFDGTIALPRDVAVMQFTAPASGQMVINQTAPPGNFLGSLLAEQPGTSFSVDDNAGVGGPDPEMAGKGYSRISFAVTAGQTYIVKVAGLGSSFGAFHLDLKEFLPTGQNLATESLGQQVTPQQLVATLLGKNNTTVQVVPGSVVYTGANNASGLFSGGNGILDSREDPSQPFDSGIVLTNGNASNVIGPNDNEGASRVNGVPGSPLLDKLVRGGTLDASTLTFQFIPTVNDIQFRYVFSSEEYNKFVGSPFDDVFGFFVNGADYARVPGTGTPLAGTGQTVSVNTINDQVNSQYYIDNTFGPSGGFGHLNTQMNGLTRVLTLEAPVRAGQVNTISLTIADTVDPQVDSAVFIQAGSLQAIREQVPPLAGLEAFAQFVQTASRSGAGAVGAGPGVAQLQFLLQQAVVDRIIKNIHLTGDFLVFPIDPVDFTLSGPNGLQITSAPGEGMSGNVPNAFYTSAGANQLLIIPNANPGEYQVELVGAGSGVSLFGASYVAASGVVTSVLLHGDLQGGRTSAVLDFQSPNGGLEQETISAASLAPLLGSGPGANSAIAIALGAGLTAVSSASISAVSVEVAARSAEVGAGASVAIPQSLSGISYGVGLGADDYPTDPGKPDPALVALLEALERGLRELRPALDRYREGGFGVLINALAPALETAETQLEHIILLLRKRSLRGLAAPSTTTPPPDAPLGSRPRVSPDRAGLPTQTQPQPLDGAINAPLPSPAQGVELRPTDSARPESKRGAVALPMVIAGMGLARLADRRALGLEARQRDQVPRASREKKRGPRGGCPGG
jgi:hypothetical protein